MSLNRRRFVAATCSMLGTSAIAAPAIAQARARVRIGYLHTLAVDGQLWLSVNLGAWTRNGLEPQFKEFKTGLELFDAMATGNIDILSTGAVISNFPARGQGKMFLVNSIEYATAQLWVREDQGIKSFADLKGKRVATTAGTTAHVFLDTALRANSIDPKEIEIQNQRMPEAVGSFISGTVPAVALWVPFNVAVREKVPRAIKLVDASAYYPRAAIVGGWAASIGYHGKNRAVLTRVVRAWAEGNDMIIARTNEALEVLQTKYYQQVPMRDLKEQFGAERVFPTAVWKQLYESGKVTKWLQQVTDFFVRIGGIENAVPADQYFDPSIFLATIRG
jgi:NitT/TauT family transport system substrate-binding protein